VDFSSDLRHAFHFYDWLKYNWLLMIRIPGATSLSKSTQKAPTAAMYDTCMLILANASM